MATRAGAALTAVTDLERLIPRNFQITGTKHRRYDLILLGSSLGLRIPENVNRIFSPDKKTRPADAITGRGHCYQHIYRHLLGGSHANGKHIANITSANIIMMALRKKESCKRLLI